MPYCGRTSDDGCQRVLVKNSIQVQLAEQHGRGLAEDEEEDREHEQDRTPAAKADDPFDDRLGAIEHDAHHVPATIATSALRRARGKRASGDMPADRGFARRHSCSFSGHVAQVEHHLLALRRENPVEILLDRSGRLADDVDLQRPGDGIRAVAWRSRPWGPRPARPAASTPSASSPPAWRSPCRCSRWPRACARPGPPRPSSRSGRPSRA